MNYEKFYDKERECLKTEKIDPDQIETLLVGERCRGEAICQRTFWYKGFIDQRCFPETVQVSYNPNGLTGPETRVDYDGVVPKGGEFTVKE